MNVALFLVWAGLVAPASAEVVTRCPKKTVAIQTADSRTPWACILPGEKYSTGVNCPRGYEAITTTNPYDPFKCAKKGITLAAPRGMCPPGHRPVPTSDPEKDYECKKIGKGFLTGPRCPRGTQPVPTPGALKPFRCVRRERASATEPTAAPNFGKKRTKKKRGPVKGRCPRGTRKVRTENPFDPIQCIPTGKRKRTHAKRRFRKKGQIYFEYSADWNLTDAWKDEIPSAYLLKNSGSDGRPISITVSRHRRRQKDYQTMQVGIRREKDWHHAQDSGQGTVGGLPAFFLNVPGEADTAFVQTGDGYYVISFSSPKFMYKEASVAYRRILKSFKHLEK
jgi:hypothetical protein